MSVEKLIGRDWTNWSRDADLLLQLSQGQILS